MRCLLLSVILAFPCFASSPTSPTPIPTRLPLEFESNAGQFPAQAGFLVRGHNFRAFFTPSGPVFIFEHRVFEQRTGSGAAATRKTHGQVLRTKFLGMNKAPQGVGLASGVSNYFLGNDPGKWRVGVPHFSKVVYRNAYPGIDIVFYGDRGGLEYDVIAEPGAEVSRLRIAFEGAGAVSVARDGALSIATPMGALRQRMARVYEESNGRRHRLQSRFVIDHEQQVRLAVSGRSLNARLVIDPVLEYSTLLGGTSLDEGTAIAVDSTGHAYVTGSTNSTDFPTTAGAFDRTCPSPLCGDAFVTKLNTTGTGLVYSTYLGGSGGDGANGIAVDSSGNAYVTGLTSSTDFPGKVIAGVLGGSTVFVTKLNASGSALIYSALFGGSVTNEGTAIALDASRNAYIAGSSQSTDFPTTPGAFQTTSAPDWHPFVAKLNASGSALVYSTRLGGTTATDFSHSIDVDSSGNAYIAGETGSTDFPTTPGSLQPTNTAGFGGFVSKLNPTGSGLIYSTFWGGLALAVATDAGQNTYVTGTAGTLRTTPGAIQGAQRGMGDAFVSKFNASGSTLLYSTFLGGSQFDSGFAIAVNSAGQAYVMGETLSSDFPVTVTGFQQVFGGGGCGDTGTEPCADTFVAKLNATGTALSYSSYLGGIGSEFLNTGSTASGSTIAIDSSGRAYVTGTTQSPNFPVTNTAFKRKVTGGMDAFVARITPMCALNTTVPSVTICTPGSGASVRSPVTIIAGTRDSRRVRVTQVYVDGAKKYEALLSAIEVKLPMSVGTHRVTVQAIDTAGVIFKKPITITVGP
ncbi:MAG TPA: SBBP repeat-containing protein [Candidatus Angelobacter sp.]|nr:SBBP repeat-containing protein [Candidatus Angelobacter sp.]